MTELDNLDEAMAIAHATELVKNNPDRKWAANYVKFEWRRSLPVATALRLAATSHLAERGWQLVPKEATDEMIEAADSVDDEYNSLGLGKRATASMHWETMLAASTNPLEAPDA